MLEPSAAADQAAGQIVGHAGPQHDWADQFSNMRLDNGSQPGGWAEEFAKVRTYLIARVHPRCRKLRDTSVFPSAMGILASV